MYRADLCACIVCACALMYNLYPGLTTRVLGLDPSSRPCTRLYGCLSCLYEIAKKTLARAAIEAYRDIE